VCDTKQAVLILRELYQACNAVFDKGICDAYLYGSYARGDFHEESDVDILVTVDVSPEELYPYRKQICDICNTLSLKYDILVSATVKSASQFQQYAEVLPFYSNVVKEGIRYAAS